jgi:transposase InsO family protein
MKIPDEIRGPLAWARLRFAIVGRLLASPPKRGELRLALKRLSRKKWAHPLTGKPVSFSVATIERWYYIAKNAPRDPVAALRRKTRKDAGTRPSLGAKLKEALQRQYSQHSGWSYKLHADNLAALTRRDPNLGRMPSYATVRRYMRETGLLKQRTDKQRQTAGAERAARRLETREVRSYEMEHVHALWHCDFHVGSLDVLTSRGEWETPILFAALDDCSRLCCHAQWYFGSEDTEKFIHGLSQAILKRGLFRSLMSDNGCGMIAAETREGLERLGTIHELTLARSPYQNGKQEVWWGQVERRLLAMLEGEPQLTLELLNEATQAWVELEYHRSLHDELGMTPLERYLAGPDVGRPSPSSAELRAAFRMTTGRSQRRSDGTVSLEARRYEVPNRYRHLRRVAVRYARWDLSYVDLIDVRNEQILSPLYPLDKHKNADSRRRRLEPVAATTPAPADDPVAPAGIAPLLAEMLQRYRQAGVPPAYLPKQQDHHDDDDKETTP